MFRKLKRLVTFCLCFLVSVFVFGQQKIKGKIVEFAGKDTSGIPGAILRWEKNTTAVFSDDKGEFEILYSVEYGRLIVSSVGSTSDTVEITHPETYLLITLNKGKMLNEVSIIEKNNGTEFSYMSAIKIEKIGQRELMKAACCNLSESFETNPSIDVNFADAVSGTKQIQMLGLSGQYSQITKENMPYLRGIASAYGLTFIPGTWIQSIQLSKGAGSVVNGYESFTGQINTELQKPEQSEQFFFNAYGNANARNEYNLNVAKKLNNTWSIGTLLHGSLNPLRQDMNKDNFIDIPTGKQINAQQRLSYFTEKGFEGQFGIGILEDEREGGEMNFDAKKHKGKNEVYGIGIKNSKKEIYAKNGFVFLNKPETSMGLQLSYSNHNQENYYGLQQYKGFQETFYGNFIFQGIFVNTGHKYKTGFSYLHDKVNENFQLMQFSRDEKVPGAFFEYAYTYLQKFNLVAGIRADQHNYYGLFLSPRLHLRYALNESKTVFRISAGKALKTASVFAENMQLMASARSWYIEAENYNLPYGLNPEEATNIGFNFTQKFKIDFRDAYATIDLYRTDFINQVVVDIDENPQTVMIRNLKGPSFSNTAQIEFGWELRKRLNIKTAYRYVDTKMTFSKGLMEKSLVSKHRSFINAGYETKNEHWQFDYTTQWFGSKRLAFTQSNPTNFKREDLSPNYFITNVQLTYVMKKKWSFDLYLGVENLFNYKQKNPIIANEEPFGNYFDASIVWAPIFGRMMYGGLRIKLK